MFKGVFFPVVAFILFIYVREMSNVGNTELMSQLTQGLVEKLGNQKYGMAVITPCNKQWKVIKSLLPARWVSSIKLVLSGEKLEYTVPCPYYSDSR
jgi:hypothetical protein